MIMRRCNVSVIIIAAGCEGGCGLTMQITTKSDFTEEVGGEIFQE